VKRVNYRSQRTLAEPVEVQGVGYLTGRQVRLRFRPAAAGTGVVFVRTDLGAHACIPARVEHVTGTQRRTTLGKAPLCVGLVEHVLAALNGLHIDNCYIELDAPEPPGLDGSARAFVEALLKVGTVVQSEQRSLWATAETIVVRTSEATLALHPPRARELRVSYLLDYGVRSPICWQMCTAEITPGGFAQSLASCRTFLLEEEAVVLREQGLGSRTRFSDLLVFGTHGPIENRLRFNNEPARHKILDILGDLALLGQDICGHIVAYRSGHPLNVELVQVLAARLARGLPRQRRAA
jgi:UDP-3-O-[3-hydroxymyristoyl] N-acetylglucosamine deacetylase